MTLRQRIRYLLKWLREGPWGMRQEALFKSRGAYRKEDFLRHFDRLGIEGEVSAEVWASFSEEWLIRFKGFSPHPEDHIFDVYGIIDEDVEELVLAVLHRCGCRIPPPSETAEMAPIVTIEDLVKFVALFRPAQEPKKTDLE